MNMSDFKDESLSDSEDEWFYESIRSYGKLQMYELELQPMRIAQLDEFHLCICGKFPKIDKYEVLIISLPPKLLLTGEEEGRCKSNDFEIVRSTGKYSRNITNIACTTEGKVIGTFADDGGLYFLEGISNERPQHSDVMADHKFNSSPHISVSSTKILASKYTEDDLIQVDTNKRKTERRWQIPTEYIQLSEEVQPCYATESTAVLLGKSTGNVATVDLRTKGSFTQLIQGEVSSQYVLSVWDDLQCVTLSSCGKCAVYDMRMPRKVIVEAVLMDNCKENNENMKIAFSNGNRVSISGVDNTMTIFEINGDTFSQVFCHKGHNHGSMRDNCYVTDHIWMPQVSENFLVSCSSNGTLICWEYR